MRSINRRMYRERIGKDPRQAWKERIRAILTRVRWVRVDLRPRSRIRDMRCRTSTVCRYLLFDHANSTSETSNSDLFLVITF